MGGVPGLRPARVWTATDECLRDGSSDHRQQAIAALMTIDRDDQAAVKVESALRDKDVIVRQYAAIALGELKASVAIPALKKMIQNTRPRFPSPRQRRSRTWENQTDAKC